VRIAARDGEQMGWAQYALVKRMPSSARRSRFGGAMIPPAIAMKIVDAEIVAEDEDDVRAIRSRGGNGVAGHGQHCP